MNKIVDPGSIRSTKGAMELVLDAKAAGIPYMQRHLKGDWGDVDYKQKKENKKNLESKTGKVISEYILSNGSRLSIVTDFDQKVTVFCLPGEDYSDLELKLKEAVECL